MPTRTATKNGNWSDVTVWDGGASLPASGDTANSNGFTVTIDQDITVVTLTATGAAGGFTIANTAFGTRTINAELSGASRILLTCNHVSGNTVVINGNVSGGAGLSTQAVRNTSTGTVNINGNVTGGSVSNSYGAHNNSTGTINIDGDVTGGSGASAYGAYNNSGGTLTITGNCTAAAAVAAQNNGAGTLTITGNVTGSSTAAVHGARNDGAGTLSVSGSVTGGSFSGSCGLYNSGTGTVSCNTAISGGDFGSVGLRADNAGGTATYVIAQQGASKVFPLQGFVRLAYDQTSSYLRTLKADNSTVDLSNDYPSAGDVKDGTTYKLGGATGTLASGGGGVPASRKFTGF